MIDNTINNDMTTGGATGTLLAGRYRVVRQLGQGGMGSVWLAEDTKLDGFKVAIKMLPSVLVNNKRAYAQVKAEALVSLKLSHPNIVAVRAFEEESGSPFLVMDYIDGQTLDDYLADRCVTTTPSSSCPAGLPEDEVIRLLKPVAAALDYAHAQGVVHRDVKPGNVMIRKDGTPFVLDFGIAREIQETMTRVTGKLSSGTLLYMSPEQLNGDAPKPAQDIYSFAAMAYECLTGYPPFSRGQIEYQIEHDAPPPLGEHVAICQQVMAGLSKQPEDRPETCLMVLNIRRNYDHKTAQGGERSRGGDYSTGSARSTQVIIVLVFLLVAELLMAVVYRASPKLYESRSVLTVDRGHPSDANLDNEARSTPQDRSELAREILNARIFEWRCENVLSRVAQRYRGNQPVSVIPDEMLIAAVTGSEILQVPHSGSLEICVRAQMPDLCAHVANAYAEVIEDFTEEKNKICIDKAVAEIHGKVEKKRREVDRINKQILDFRMTNKIDSLRSTRETLDLTLQQTTKDVLKLEGDETQLVEWEKMLAAVQKDPASYGSLSANVLRAQDIEREYRAYQTAEVEYQKIRLVFTEGHPEVIEKRAAANLMRQRFLDAVARAFLTGRSTLQVARNQLANLKTRQGELRTELASIEQRIVLAESGLKMLEDERDIQKRALEGLCTEESQSRINAESHNETVRVVCPASVPLEPCSSNAKILFGGGGLVSLVLGLIVAMIFGRRTYDVFKRLREGDVCQ